MPSSPDDDEEYMQALRDERRKIEAFKRELPCCMELLDTAIEAARRRISSITAADHEKRVRATGEAQSPANQENRRDCEMDHEGLGASEGNQRGHDEVGVCKEDSPKAVRRGMPHLMGKASDADSEDDNTEDNGNHHEGERTTMQLTVSPAAECAVRKRGERRDLAAGCTWSMDDEWVHREAKEQWKRRQAPCCDGRGQTTETKFLQEHRKIRRQHRSSSDPVLPVATLAAHDSATRTHHNSDTLLTSGNGHSSSSRSGDKTEDNLSPRQNCSGLQGVDGKPAASPRRRPSLWTQRPPAYKKRRNEGAAIGPQGRDGMPDAASGIPCIRDAWGLEPLQLQYVAPVTPVAGASLREDRSSQRWKDGAVDKAQRGGGSDGPHSPQGSEGGKGVPGPTGGLGFKNPKPRSATRSAPMAVGSAAPEKASYARQRHFKDGRWEEDPKRSIDVAVEGENRAPRDLSKDELAGEAEPETMQRERSLGSGNTEAPSSSSLFAAREMGSPLRWRQSEQLDADSRSGHLEPEELSEQGRLLRSPAPPPDFGWPSQQAQAPATTQPQSRSNSQAQSQSDSQAQAEAQVQAQAQAQSQAQAQTQAQAQEQEQRQLGVAALPGGQVEGPGQRGDSRIEEQRGGQDHGPVQQNQQVMSRKARRCWSAELHQRFLVALEALGGSNAATPKQIREYMKVEGLTNDEVKSHLQKYRLHNRRIPSSSETGAPSEMSVPLARPPPLPSPQPLLSSQTLDPPALPGPYAPIQTSSSGLSLAPVHAGTGGTPFPLPISTLQPGLPGNPKELNPEHPYPPLPPHLQGVWMPPHYATAAAAAAAAAMAAAAAAATGPSLHVHTIMPQALEAPAEEAVSPHSRSTESNALPVHEATALTREQLLPQASSKQTPLVILHGPDQSQMKRSTQGTEKLMFPLSPNSGASEREEFIDTEDRGTQSNTPHGAAVADDTIKSANADPPIPTIRPFFPEERLQSLENPATTQRDDPSSPLLQAQPCRPSSKEQQQQQQRQHQEHHLPPQEQQQRMGQPQQQQQRQQQEHVPTAQTSLSCHPTGHQNTQLEVSSLQPSQQPFHHQMLMHPMAMYNPFIFLNPRGHHFVGHAGTEPALPQFPGPGANLLLTSGPVEDRRLPPSAFLPVGRGSMQSSLQMPPSTEADASIGQLIPMKVESSRGNDPK